MLISVHYQNNNSWQRSVLVDMNHGEDFRKVPFSGCNIEQPGGRKMWKVLTIWNQSFKKEIGGNPQSNMHASFSHSTCWHS